MIKVKVKDRVITCKKSVVSKNVDTFKLYFEFDDVWEGYNKRVVFYNDSLPENTVTISVEDSCIIPWEVLQEEGNLYLTIIGTLSGTSKTIVTREMDNPIIVYKAGTDSINGPMEPTPDIVEELKSAISLKLDARYPVEDKGKVISVNSEGIALPLGKLPNKWRKIADIEVNENIQKIEITKDLEGNPFKLSKARLLFNVPQVESTTVRINPQIDYMPYSIDEEDNEYGGFFIPAFNRFSSTTSPRDTVVNIEALNFAYGECITEFDGNDSITIGSGVTTANAKEHILRRDLNFFEYFALWDPVNLKSINIGTHITVWGIDYEG